MGWCNEAVRRRWRRRKSKRTVPRDCEGMAEAEAEGEVGERPPWEGRVSEEDRKTPNDYTMADRCADGPAVGGDVGLAAAVANLKKRRMTSFDRSKIQELKREVVRTEAECIGCTRTVQRSVKIEENR
jgi:hypothetical protein